MESHPAFSRLRMHSDLELASLLGVGIAERKTIHEWSLSCVQRLVLEDGRKLIYKTQLPPTVEAAFYRRAVSSLLPGHRFLARVEDCDILLLDWIDAPLLRDAMRDERALMEHGTRLMTEIGHIHCEMRGVEENNGGLPVYLDIGSAKSWSSMTGETLRKLETLILQGRFRRIGQDRVEALRRWTQSAAVLERVVEHPRLIHGDLKASQVFLDGDGYKLIDWQRPMIASPEVDGISLLVAEGIDPRPYFAAELVGIFWFLFLRWAVVAQSDLFPDFPGPLFSHWASAAATQILDPDAALPEGIPPA